MPKEMRFDAEARDALRRGFDQLADTVRVTLGPRGRNVVLDKQWGSPLITNDGVTIAREIELVDPFENMGAQLGREISSRTQDVAGDGTTTATVLAQTMVRAGHRMVAGGARPMAVKRGLDKACEAVVAEIARRSKKLKGREQIASVAAVAANNDEVLGALLADALTRVGRDGVVTVEEGKGLRTTLSLVEGMQFDRGYLSSYFVTDPEKMQVDLRHALVLLVDRKLSSLNELLPVLQRVAETGRPLLIVAEDVEGDALAGLVVNRLRGTLETVAVKAPGFGDRRREMLEDLAVLVGGAVVSEELGRTLESVELRDLGSAERVTVGRDLTTIVEGGGSARGLKDRIAQLRAQLADTSSDYDREKLEERVAKLSGGVAVIEVGAATESEMKETKARVEDALAATRAAVAEGVVPGGGLTLLRAAAVVDALALEGDEALGARVLREGLLAPLAQIAANAGVDGAVAVERVLAERRAVGFNARSLVYEDLARAGILDPARVVRATLQNAVSIAGLILTTDTLVAEVEAEPETEDDSDQDDD